MSASYELASCPVCASRNATELLDQDAVRRQVEELWDFHLHRLKPGAPTTKLYDRVTFSQEFPLRIVECRECGTVYRDPREDGRTLLETYAGEDVNEASLEALFEQQLDFYRGPARRLTREVGRAGSGLEVGSYIGAFLAAAHEQGWNFEGIDINVCTNRFAEKKQLRVAHGTLDTFETDRKYDAIALWNCLDQLPNPRATLMKAKSLLRDGGVVAIRIPNGALFATLQRRMPRPIRPLARAILAYNNLLAFPYRNGFTPSSLERLARAAGFERVAVHPSALVSLQDQFSPGWSKWEEKLIKAMHKIVRTPSLAPWLEIYAS